MVFGFNPKNFFSFLWNKSEKKSSPDKLTVRGTSNEKVSTSSKSKNALQAAQGEQPPAAPPAENTTPSSISATGDPPTGEPSSSDEETVEAMDTTDPSKRYDEDSGEEIYYVDKDDDEDIVNMTRVFKTQTESFKLPLPIDFPDYVHDKPDLEFKLTRTYVKRRAFSVKLLKDAGIIRKGSSDKKPVTKPKKPTAKQEIIIPPKSNKASELREKYIKRQDLMPSRFVEHFNKYKKPPFHNTLIKTAFAQGMRKKGERRHKKSDTEDTEAASTTEAVTKQQDAGTQPAGGEQA